MRLTQFSDYALRLMIFAAANNGRLVTIDETAKAYNISQTHLMKVANQLTKTGFLAATRGRSGGLQLATAASNIRIGDIIRATEPDFAIAECMGNNNNCILSRRCKLTGILSEALDAFLSVADRYTLDDISAVSEVFITQNDNILEHNI